MATETMINFPKGIPGFEIFCNYIMTEEENSMLAQLVADNEKSACFVMVKPQIFFPDYLPNVDFGNEEAALLEVEEGDTLEIWAILTLNQKDMGKTTANLRAPIIINRKKRKGAQFILTEDKYLSRQALFSNPDPVHEVSREGVAG